MNNNNNNNKFDFLNDPDFKYSIRVLSNSNGAKKVKICKYCKVCNNCINKKCKICGSRL